MAALIVIAKAVLLIAFSALILGGMAAVMGVELPPAADRACNAAPIGKCIFAII